MTDDVAAPEAPEEESYFVSMTDIMVGLLFVFIIMLMTFALQYRGATATMRDADELVDEAKRTLLTEVGNLLTAAGVPITVNLEQGVIHLPESVLFEPARAELPEKGRLAVNHVRAPFGQSHALLRQGSSSCLRITRRLARCPLYRRTLGQRPHS